jgi:hypothetical protein
MPLNRNGGQSIGYDEGRVNTLTGLDAPLEQLPRGSVEAATQVGTLEIPDAIAGRTSNWNPAKAGLRQ